MPITSLKVDRQQHHVGHVHCHTLINKYGGDDEKLKKWPPKQRQKRGHEIFPILKSSMKWDWGKLPSLVCVCVCVCVCVSNRRATQNEYFSTINLLASWSTCDQSCLNTNFGRRRLQHCWCRWWFAAASVAQVSTLPHKLLKWVWERERAWLGTATGLLLLLRVVKRVFTSQRVIKHTKSACVCVW